MIVSLALSLLSAFAPRAGAAVVAAEPAAYRAIASAPLALPSIVAPAVLSAAVPAASAPLAAPALAAAPAPAASIPAPAPAPALRAAPAAAAAERPDARRTLTQAASPEPDAAAAAFDGALRAPALDRTPAVAPIEGRSPSRLQVLSAKELGVSAEPETPRPPSSDPQPFLYRHYRFVRAVVAPLLRLFYGIRVEGFAHLPPGPALIVPNHNSYLDPILISFAANRPIRFVMERGIYETYGFQWLFRSLGAIPISTKDPKNVIEESLNRARRALAAGETVVMFPEGRRSDDGDFGVYRRGFERVALGLAVPVVPAYIDGMWGSVMSKNLNWRRSLRAHLRGRRPVAVSFGPELERADAALAREAVARLAAPR